MQVSFTEAGDMAGSSEHRLPGNGRHGKKQDPLNQSDLHTRELEENSQHALGLLGS